MTLTHTQLNEAARLSATNVFTGSRLTLSASPARFELLHSAGGADAKKWWFNASANALGIYSVNDAEGVSNLAINISRAGAALTAIDLTATTITLNGVAATDFARLSQQNNFSDFLASTTTGTTCQSLDSTNAAGGFIRIKRNTTTFLFIGNANAVNGATLDDGAIYANANLRLTSAGGSIFLNGVNATDFARLSQTNTITANANATLGFNLNNNSAGASAALNLRLDNGTTATQLIQTGTGATLSGIGISAAPALSGLWLGTNAVTPFVLGTNNAAALVISGSQNFDFKAGTVTTNNASASEVGYKGTPPNTQNGNYTLVLADAGGLIRKQSGAGNTITIPANASVAFPDGTIITIDNDSGNAVSIAITTDVLELAGTGTTGTRTLSDNGSCSIQKIASTKWRIAGTGVS
jgi:hypothetical protein